MGKSLKNAVAPDEMCERYGADTLRLYEMFGGPLDQSRPWDTTAVVGMYRLLQRVWRLFVDEDAGTPRVSDDAPSDDTLRHLHRTIVRRFGGTLAMTAPSTAHQIAFDLAADAPAAWRAEPPGFVVHAWHGGALVSHVVASGDHRPDRPFDD